MKKIVANICFCLMVVFMISWLDEIFVPKTTNRYYMLRKELENQEEDYDVQIYGSCHAYTSFDPRYLEEEYAISSYVMANPGEIIPTTWIRMTEQFKEYVPEVALVDVWGINPYETYDLTEDILGDYFQANIEQLPLSLEKIEVILDFDTLDNLEATFPISTYKERLVDLALREWDFKYSFDLVKEYSNEYVVSEMQSRFANRGFRAYPAGPIVDYLQRQSKVENDDYLEIESDIEKYVRKIIDLCEEYGVKLIFYRAPYIATENELRKVNCFQVLCEEEGVLFLDLEEEIQWDYQTDFYDYYHLSESGALKSTKYLTEYILEYMDAR